MNKERICFYAGVIWATIGFGGALAIATVMRFFETDVNFFLAFGMLAWVIFWVMSGRVMRLSHRIAGAIAKGSVEKAED